MGLFVTRKLAGSPNGARGPPSSAPGRAVARAKNRAAGERRRKRRRSSLFHDARRPERQEVAHPADARLPDERQFSSPVDVPGAEREKRPVKRRKSSPRSSRPPMTAMTATTSDTVRFACPPMPGRACTRINITVQVAISVAVRDSTHRRRRPGRLGYGAGKLCRFGCPERGRCL